MRGVPREMALGEREEALAAKGAVYRLRKTCLSPWDVSEALVPLCEAWRSASDEGKARIFDAVGPSLAKRLRKHNREALKALGNSVVPAVVREIGVAIMQTEGALNG